MLGTIIWGASLALLVHYVVNVSLGYRRNIASARKMGVEVIVTPINRIGWAWMTTFKIWMPLIYRLPGSEKWLWTKVSHPNSSWINRRLVCDAIKSDTYVTVSSNLLYLSTCSPSLISQITSLPSAFRKPMWMYEIVGFYGKSISTTEDAEWRKHRRVIAPAFSEKNNEAVFRESIRQAEGLLDLWGRKYGGNAIQAGGKTGERKVEMRVKNAAPDLQMLSLHVICGVGFGAPQTWPGQTGNGSKSQSVELDGINTGKLAKGHTMEFKKALGTLLRHILLKVLTPKWVLKNSPLKIHKETYLAYTETGAYFNELYEDKLARLRSDQSSSRSADLLESFAKSTLDTNSSLTRSEIVSNSFIICFAGHETSANSLFYSLIFLAMNLPSQRHLQADIDSILQSRPPSEWDYRTDMPLLYNSMVGACMNEQLRLVPSIIDIPKTLRGEQRLTEVDFEGNERELVFPDGLFVHINAVGVARNPRWYPHRKWQVEGEDGEEKWANDMDDFVPERWLGKEHRFYSYKDNDIGNDKGDETDHMAKDANAEEKKPTGSSYFDAQELASFERGSLYRPPPGSFIPWSDGARGCPGKRFAQIEIVTVLAVIFSQYSVELDVSDFASDEMVQQWSEMGEEGIRKKREVYQRARERAQRLIDASEPIITLQMRSGSVPVRVVRRGCERFAEC